jgi:hypothetical protein
MVFFTLYTGLGFRSPFAFCPISLLSKGRHFVSLCPALKFEYYVTQLFIFLPCDNILKDLHICCFSECIEIVHIEWVPPDVSINGVPCVI